MPNFVGFCRNERFTVGCTGQSVYVFDSDGNELARFKGLKYAYTALLNPAKDSQLIVKQTEGIFLIYDLDKLELVKKFRFAPLKEGGAQCDNGWSFSPDGKFLYNIEIFLHGYKTRLSIYETENFECVQQLFTSESDPEPLGIEYDTPTGKWYLFARRRTDHKIFEFIAELHGEQLENIRQLKSQDARVFQAYLGVKKYGFTANLISVYTQVGYPADTWNENTYRMAIFPEKNA